MIEKVTQRFLESIIEDVYYDTHKTVTICHLTLCSGFSVRGESACMNPADFDADIGRQLSYKDAFNKLWQLEGYHRMASAWEAGK
jgi:hypothetical protein